MKANAWGMGGGSKLHLGKVNGRPWKRRRCPGALASGRREKSRASQRGRCRGHVGGHQGFKKHIKFRARWTGAVNNASEA